VQLVERATVEHRGLFTVARAKKNKQAGEAFNELLIQKKITKYKLAKETGLGRDHIGRIASGEIAAPEPTTLAKIATVLKIELGELTRIFAQSNVQSQHAAANPKPQESISNMPISTNPDFVGREEAIAHLNNVIKQGVKIILIYAKGGIGKTKLAWEYIQQFDLVLELRMAKETQNICSANSIIEEWLRQKFNEDPGQEFSITLERLRQHLRNSSKRIGVLIDNLEPALDGNGKFIKAHRSYVELLRVLADEGVKSVTLITSRDRLHESSVKIHDYRLKGLAVEVWQEFFNSRYIKTDTSSLSIMHNAYGGNAKVMEILCGIIKEDYSSNLEEYWQENQSELLKDKSLEDLVISQFERLEEIDRDAYRLLYRLGCYRYQTFPSVSIEGLLCLLWDVPESQQWRVVKSLQDRSLVECENREYWLHPMICSEAIKRLKQTFEWRETHEKAASFWSINFSQIVKSEQLKIQMIDLNQVKSYEEYLYLLIDYLELVAKEENYPEEIIAFEIFYHLLCLHNLDSLEELILQTSLSDNSGILFFVQLIFECVEWRKNLSKSIYELGKSTFEIALIDQMEFNFQQSKQGFEYWQRCLEASQKLMRKALSIAVEFKLDRLGN
jgi:transcriptional regulator with XRE-family HTH domain